VQSFQLSLKYDYNKAYDVLTILLLYTQKRIGCYTQAVSELLGIKASRVAVLSVSDPLAPPPPLPPTIVKNERRRLSQTTDISASVKVEMEIIGFDSQGETRTATGSLAYSAVSPKKNP
jgi:hypothetical protein